MKGSTAERIALEILSHDHIDHYLSVFSRTVRDVLRVESVESERVYLKHVQQEPGTYFFCIFTRDERALIGAIAIRDAQVYAGQLYCWLHERYWGSGYFQQALILAAQIYFANTDRAYFTARVDCTNMRSYRALKKAGFADIGLVRGAYCRQFELVLRRQRV